jgi:spermidine/putrescine-binding protein
MDKILFIPVGGEIEDLSHDNPGDISLNLSIIREKVGADIDHFQIIWEGKQGMGWCDDMGLVKELPLNKRATQAYADYWATRGLVARNPIVGPAVFCFGKYNR